MGIVEYTPIPAPETKSPSLIMKAPVVVGFGSSQASEPKILEPNLGT